jgi:hypothetical protein
MSVYAIKIRYRISVEFHLVPFPQLQFKLQGVMERNIERVIEKERKREKRERE